MTDVLKVLVAASMLLFAATQPVLAQDSQTQEADEAPVGEGAPMASEEDELAAEDAAVEDVLSEAELIYRNDGEDGDFIPSEQVSADQSLDYPIDI